MKRDYAVITSAMKMGLTCTTIQVTGSSSGSNFTVKVYLQGGDPNGMDPTNLEWSGNDWTATFQPISAEGTYQAVASDSNGTDTADVLDCGGIGTMTIDIPEEVKQRGKKRILTLTGTGPAGREVEVVLEELSRSGQHRTWRRRSDPRGCCVTCGEEERILGQNTGKWEVEMTITERDCTWVRITLRWLERIPRVQKWLMHRVR